MVGRCGDHLRRLRERPHRLPRDLSVHPARLGPQPQPLLEAVAIARLPGGAEEGRWLGGSGREAPVLPSGSRSQFRPGGRPGQVNRPLRAAVGPQPRPLPSTHSAAGHGVLPGCDHGPLRRTIPTSPWWLDTAGHRLPRRCTARSEVGMRRAGWGLGGDSAVPSSVLDRLPLLDGFRNWMAGEECREPAAARRRQDTPPRPDTLELTQARPAHVLC